MEKWSRSRQQAARQSVFSALCNENILSNEQAIVAARQAANCIVSGEAKFAQRKEVRACRSSIVSSLVTRKPLERYFSRVLKNGGDVRQGVANYLTALYPRSNVCSK